MKRYEIETLSQLVNVVDDENFDRITTDFVLWLNYMKEMFKQVKESNPEYKNKSNSEIAKSVFIWNDDGIIGLRNAHIKVTETGEIIELNTQKEGS
jgi:hypothetical protein